MIKYKFDKKLNRVIAYSEDIVIGMCEYVVKDNYWNIIHTQIDKMYQGKGIARDLVNEVILNANKNNKKVIADCSYAKMIIKNNG